MAKAPCPEFRADIHAFFPSLFLQKDDHIHVSYTHTLVPQTERVLMQPKCPDITQQVTANAEVMLSFLETHLLRETTVLLLLLLEKATEGVAQPAVAARGCVADCCCCVAAQSVCLKFTGGGITVNFQPFSPITRKTPPIWHIFGCDAHNL